MCRVVGKVELHKSQRASVRSFHHLKLRGVGIGYHIRPTGGKIVGLQGSLLDSLPNSVVFSEL